MTTRLVFLDRRRQVRVSATLMLAVMGALYFVGGMVYAATVYPNFERMLGLVAVATIGFSVGVLLGSSKRSITSSDTSLRSLSTLSVVRAQRSEVLLLLFAFGLLLLACSFYLLVPSGYFSMDKVERAPALRTLYGVRVLFFVSGVAYYLSLMKGDVVQNVVMRRLHFLYLVLYTAVTLVEINREMLLVLGILVLCWAGRFRYYFPRFFPGQLALLVLTVLLFFTLKGLLYPIFFATAYEGGLLSFGEVVNWMRWTAFAFDRDVDLGELHRNDWRYLMNALVFPASAYESASAIWFREILQIDSVGQTYGYSGLLSWYAVGGWHGVFALPAILGFICAKLDASTNPIAALASFCLVMVSFRFFRSEYVLVVKTYLWQFFYPGVLLYYVSKFRIQVNPTDVLQELMEERPRKMPSAVPTPK
jgi:hypothetical protein